MRVISRRENEGVVIGDEIFVTVLEIREGHVRVAIASRLGTPSYWEETLHWAPRRGDEDGDEEADEAELELISRA